MADALDYKKMLADPVIEYVLRASNAMPDSLLVRTIPLRELLQFARALLAARGAKGQCRECAIQPCDTCPDGVGASRHQPLGREGTDGQEGAFHE